MDDVDKKVPPPRDVTDELRSRRAEAIQVAVRSFAVSRQSLTDGTLSNSERLIRYYEGIAMSLQRRPTVDAYEENIAAFRSVLRYSRHETKVPADKLGKVSADTQDDCDPVLVRQAAYNLAVLHHRRIVQLRTESQEGVVGAVPDETPNEIVRLYAEAKRFYESVITELQEINHWAGGKADQKDLQSVDFATYIAGSAGWILLVVDAYMNAAQEKKGEYLKASIGQLNLRKYCDETVNLLTSVCSQYQEKKKGLSGHTGPQPEVSGGAKHTSWYVDIFRALGSKEKQQKDAQAARRPSERNSAPILSALLWQLNAAKEQIPDAPGT